MTPTPKSNGNGAPDLDRLWDARRVCSFLSVSDRWLRRAMSASQFPRPDFRLNGTHGMRWRRETVEDFLTSKATGNGVTLK